MTALTLRDYQSFAASEATRALATKGWYGLCLGCGLGKTAVTLHVLDYINLIQGCKRVLVTCPPRVMTHWRTEQDKWSKQPQTIGPPVVLLDGSPGQRLNRLKSNFHATYVISDYLLPWLVKQKGIPSFSAFIVDEGSRYKNWSAAKTKAARAIARTCRFRMTLTGSPTPNHDGEIFPQQYLLDLGVKLGSTIGGFRKNYMFRGGFEDRQWFMREEKQHELRELIADDYLHMKTDDYLDIPPLREINVKFQLSPDNRKQYKQLHEEMMIEFAGDPILAYSSSQRYSMCRQFTSGFLYDEGTPKLVHKTKLETLAELLDELPRPVIIAYQFRYEYQLISNGLARSNPDPDFDPAGLMLPALNGDVSCKQGEEILARFKAGKIPILCVQTQSIAHGVDGMQGVCSDLIWFSQTDSSEMNGQLIARLHRIGQSKPVGVYYLMAEGTVDVAIRRMVSNKQCNQKAFLEYLRK